MKLKSLLVLTGLGLWIMARRLLRYYSFAGKVVLITGGSRGLGLALARQFAREGAHLALLARDEAELERATADVRHHAGHPGEGGGEIWSSICELRDRDEVQATIAQAAEHFGRLDVLVNNAGEMTVGPLETMTPADFHEAMDVHFWATFYAMNAAIPRLRQHGGRIINIISIGGKVAVPHLAPYCASKFAQAGLSDAFRAELAKNGILITSVFPGLMRTGSHLNAWFKGDHHAEYAWFSLGAGLPFSSIAATRAARQILNASRNGQAQLIITIQARLLVLASTLFPNMVGRFIAFINRLLPTATRRQVEVHSGWESLAPTGPSVLTRLADKASEEFNQLRGHQPVISSALGNGHRTGRS